MNRQIRRAQEKSDKRKERETEKRKTARLEAREERRARVRAAREARRAGGTVPASDGTSSASGIAASAERARRTGRFAGFMAVVTAVFIVMRAFAPEADPDQITTVIGAAFYIFLGYFSCLWLMRKGVQQAVPVTITSGIALATVVEVLKGLNANVAAQPLLVLAAAPGLILGVIIARWVHARTL